MSRLFDRLKNAARLRRGAHADRSLLTQALQRAADERALARAASQGAVALEPTAAGLEPTAAARAEAEEEALAKARLRAEAQAKLHEQGRAGPSRKRAMRGITGALILVALATLVVVSLHLAQRPPAPEPVPTFQIDRTLR